MKKIFQLLLSFLLIIQLFAPVWVNAQEVKDVTELSFEELLAESKGSTVNFYGWGGDEKLNRWLDEVYGPALKEKYDINFQRVPMDIDQILSQLVSEKQAGTDKSEIDMIWINGENFKTAKENDLLHGPFTEQMPNYQKMVDSEDIENQKDFGYPIEGYEAPYSKAQLVLVKDAAITEDTPDSAAELLAYAKANPGQFTYPALPDFTGSAFVRNIIYEFVEAEQFQGLEADKEKVKEMIQPALDYLNELKPYLWNEGQTYPNDGPALNNLFMDGEVAFHITYGAYDVAYSIEDGSYPETAMSFVFDKGTVGNTNFIAIGKNSIHKAAAIVAINEMLSSEMQLSKYEQLGLIPVLSNQLLDEETQAKFKAINPGKGTIPQDRLLDQRLPEMPAQIVPIIEEIWLEEVAGN